MKLQFVFYFLFPIYLCAQTYETKINSAGAALQNKAYCKALIFFEDAFTDTAKIGTYDLAYGAAAAANCNKEKLALTWLKMSQQKGLGLNPGEAESIASDSMFIKLHGFAEWSAFVAAMKNGLIEQEKLENQKRKNWVNTIKENGVSNTALKVKKGYALYFTKVDQLEVPFLVFVPQNYNPKKKSKAIVYLHGGVVNADTFDYQNPDIAKEPIFEIGSEFNTLIIYPFGKKDFGWVNQVKAFQNIYTIIKAAKRKYNIGSVYLGGMSNGGTAAFWYASKKENQFKGFFAFSPNPNLEIEAINFKNISQGKPFLTINAVDDSVFEYSAVQAIYNKNKASATDWVFNSIASGNHGFIYNANEGLQIMKDLFKKLLK